MVFYITQFRSVALKIEGGRCHFSSVQFSYANIIPSFTSINFFPLINYRLSKQLKILEIDIFYYLNYLFLCFPLCPDPLPFTW